MEIRSNPLTKKKIEKCVPCSEVVDSHHLLLSVRTEMEAVEIVDLTSDDEGEKVGSEAVMSVKQEYEEVVAKYQSCQSHSNKQVSEENISSGVLSTHSYSDVLEQSLLPDDDTGLSLSPPPICRNFWKAGNYDHEFGSEVNVPSSYRSLINKLIHLGYITRDDAGNYLHVHPLFLHSNATSHKWAFGAIAELLDNAVDEIQNGATFVIVDKVLNPKDGSPALLIQDDGGGMDPEAMRHCMSFGFSDKKSKITIGQYGNGFKTGSMRLGADVIVFSHRLNNMILTQSIGLLSYTFLMRTQLDRIVVPMVSYKYDTSIGDMEILNDKGQFTSNLSILLQWSPYLSEAELLEQCNDIGSHGTKIVIFNLWLDNNGNLELDFDADPEVVLSFLLVFLFSLC
ncbi:hypothetical protein RJT34_33293 [Clitoria ternatea]|uniref:Protein MICRORCHIDIA 6 n=1 Tax=Clitoria ternatea TaxID=43366 RepID=A0AAN9EZN2_CLITE